MNEKDKNRPITHLALYLTENCNLACEYCFAAGHGKEDLPWERAKKAVDMLFRFAGDEKRVSITFWGGEPFLRFGMMRRVVEYGEDRAAALGKTIRFSAPTNATLLRPKSLDFCLEHEIALSLSLDGAEGSQGLRPLASGGSSFPLVRKVLPLIRERLGREAAIRMTCSAERASHFFEDVQFFLEQGFREIRFYPAFEGDWTAERVDAYRRQMEKLADHYRGFFRQGKREEIPRFRAFDDVFRRFLLREKGRSGDPEVEENLRRSYCGAGKTTICLSVSGDLFPCHRFVFYDREKKFYRLGNLTEGITEPERRREFQDIDIARGTSGGMSCTECDLWGICTYFCVAHNYDFSGDIYGIHPNVCRLIRILHGVCRGLYDDLKENEIFLQYMRYRLSRGRGRLSERLLGSLFEGTWEEMVDTVAERAWRYLEGEDERCPPTRPS
jgi:uncharacterized protein